jgi:hypothetical protein
MKTITEIIGRAQGLLNIPYNLREVLEEYLTDEYKTFLHILRVLEEARNPLIRGYAGTGRIPYQYQPFVRSVFAKCFFRVKYPRQRRGLEFVNRAKRFLLFVIPPPFFQSFLICPSALPCLV